MLGVPAKCYQLIALFSENVALLTIHICIELQKLRTNMFFALLTIDFEISTPNTSKVFHNLIKILTEKIQEFINWPLKKDIEIT